MKKFLIKLHKILGLTAALTIFISCLTGAIMVFQDEVRELSHHARYFRPASNGRTPLPLETLIPLVNDQLREGKVEAIQIEADTTRNYIFTPSKPKRSQIFVDPYTGQITGKIERGNPDFFGFTMRLHRWLMDGSQTWGKQIMGASTLIFVCILISGIVYWWPKSKKQLKARLQVKTSASRHRFLADLHASLGIYAVSLLLVMALTGLTWSYPWYRSGLYAILGIELPKEEPKSKAEAPHKTKDVELPKDADHPFPWDKAYALLRAEQPKHKYIRLEIGKANIGSVQVVGNPRRSDEYKLDKVSGNITKYIPYGEQPAASRARGWIYALHTGSWAGMWSKVLYFIVAVLGASFPITGVYLYFKKNRKKVKR